MLEKDFQQAVIDLARHGGWKVHHARTVKMSTGHWATVQGDNGFPDLMLAHRHKGIIFAELKTDKGRLSDAQLEWIATLEEAGAEVYVWRPAQMNLIAERLCPHPSHLRRLK